ncbi:hypothetical protein F3Y22_tig00110299pilonHSYRG00117 [Hibiscus syriacus]|uniref:Ubiquitin-like protease family profile domain-containing protein n=1 Tax=Hibiscus syriacus TaxID=106335 RepID=A0A6A3B4Y6_HIBSY|nr:hypothetical protein F3Y22_tig00110299pilonHSYRG00117 [Hibiscus syriacus]
MDECLRTSARTGNVSDLYRLIRADRNALMPFEDVEFVDTPLHIAAEQGCMDFALERMNLKPPFARKLNQDRLSPVPFLRFLWHGLRRNQNGSTSSRDLEAGIKEWNLSLVGQFLGVAPSFSSMQRLVYSFWRKSLAGARVQEPNLQKLSFDLSSLPIWVHLFNVPLELYSHLGLSYIASAIEVELKEGEKVSIMVELPRMPARCNYCKTFDHNENSCTQSNNSINAKPQVWRKKETFSKVIETEPSVRGIELLQEKEHILSKEVNVKNVAVEVKENKNNKPQDEQTNHPVTTDKEPRINVEDQTNKITEHNVAYQDHSVVEQTSSTTNVTHLKNQGEFSSTIPKRVCGRHAKEKQKVDIAGSTNKFQVLNDIDDLTTVPVENQRKSRASSLGVVANVKELNMKKEDKQDKSKSAEVVGGGCMKIQGQFQNAHLVITAIYRSSDGIARRLLWQQLCDLEDIVGLAPWIIGGDFNIILHSYESSDCDLIGPLSTPDIRDFQEVLFDLDLIDHPFCGPSFTWRNKQLDSYLAWKLDRVLVYSNWVTTYKDSYVEFQAPEVINFFTNLIGTEDPAVINTNPNMLKDLIKYSLPADKADSLVQEVTKEEIKETFFNQGNEKSPSPDGFSPFFFKKLGRSITDNTLPAHELVRGYSRKNISPRCSLKIDLHKAFDSLNWNFISAILKAIGLPRQLFLPNSVLKKIEQLCSRFFWKGIDKAANGARLRPEAHQVLSSGELKATAIWDLIREKKPKVPWHKLLWFPLYIPKHSLIAWMAFLDRLPTKERLQRMGLINESLCVHCNSELETREHFFLKCPTAVFIWETVFSLSGLHFTACSWETFEAWACLTWKGKSLLTLVMKIVLNALIYIIWEERNKRVFQGRFRSAEEIFKAIKDIGQRRLCLSPMHLAVKKVHVEMALGFVEMDKDVVRVKGKNGNTPLHLISKVGNHHGLLLLDRILGVCPESIGDVTTKNRTALHIETKNKRLDVLKVLIQMLRKKDKNYYRQMVNQKDRHGNTALHIASSNNQPQMLRLLLDCKADKHATNQAGWTALDVAIGQIVELSQCIIQALPNQQTVDYPSFKLVIVHDVGTGNFIFLCTPISISHSLRRRNPSPSPKISVPISGEIPHNHSLSEIPHNIQKWKINLRGLTISLRFHFALRFCRCDFHFALLFSRCDFQKFFSAQLTLRNKVSLATTIASKLSPAQRQLFEETCFGPWLRVQHPGGDANLTHLWLQTMTSNLPDSIQRGEEEIWFHFPPAYTCFGRKEFCLITGLRFGHDDVGRYTRHIARPSWLSRVFPDESMEKPNLHVDDLKKLFNKKAGFTRMDDVDVVRDLNAWNLFPWGSYIWKATWTKLSSAFDDRKSLRGDGSKYTLSGFVWAFKIWIFEAFPSMRTYAIKTSNDIPRAISWKRKTLLDWEDLIPYATINNEANIPLQRLTPTEEELATDWWQASQSFFDGTDDEQHPLPPIREPSPHLEPSPDRPDYTPLEREPSPIPSHHRASSPPSPHDRRPAKMPRLLSPCSPPPPQRDESRELRDEVNALREEIGTLRDNDGAWRVEVSTLRGEVAALREMIVSLQNEVHTLRNERPDRVDALRRVMLARRSSRIRQRARAIKSPYTPIVRRHRKKKPDSHVIPQESTPIVEEAPPIIPRESPPTVQEATVIIEEVPPTIQEPDSHGVICRLLEKPSDVPDMMDSSWLSYELPASTIPVSEEEREQLPDTILDNTLWAKTAVDFIYMSRARGVEDNGYFDGGKLKKNKNIRYTIMPTSFHAVHLKNARDESFDLGNGQAKLYPAWWEVDKVFIPILERKHWILVELQLPSLKTIVYDSMINYISLADLRDVIKGWSSHLAKFLDAINYWTRSGNKKPKKLNITVIRDETAPQQTSGARGDCGPLVCLALERLTTGSIKYLPPTDRDRAAVGLWFRHYMAKSIYTRRCLPASAL